MSRFMRAEYLFPGCRVQVDERWRVVAAVEFPDPDTILYTLEAAVIVPKTGADVCCLPEEDCVTGLSTELRVVVPNARFWLWWQGGWVKITIPADGSLACHESHATDEGYSFTAEHFEHEGFRVVRRHTSGGCDCDGPLEYRHDSACLFADLQAIPAESDEYGDNPPRANWQTLSRSQRDAYAEAAGY